MRRISKIILHCSDTYAHQDIGFKEINEWHEARGFKDRDGDEIFCGYHFIVRRNGVIELGRPLERAGAHCRGHNANSIGICMVGGKGKDNRAEANFTRRQWEATDARVESLLRVFPDAELHGHNEFSNKECPTFPVDAWWG